ncbi:MAG: endo-1,4-beta-xylanase [Planctomycetota bacterium]
MNRFVSTIRICMILCVAISLSANAAGDDIDQMIRKHRMGELTIRAKPGANVQVEQVRHEFWFGAAISSSAFSGRLNSEDQHRYKQVFLSNFNAAVTENALKWHAMEPRKGHVDYTIVDAILKWTEENNIPLRGHNLFWGVPGRVQNWQKKMDDKELREALRIRATTIARRYKGRFAEYDLNNEMIHGNYYADRLGPGITKQMTDWVKQVDPDARLYLNDYDILTGRQLDKYIKHIRGLLDEGASIDGVGVQGHLHGDSFDPKALRHALDKLAAEGLPVCITEFNFPGQRSRVYRRRDLKLTPDQEKAKAEALTTYYRICFAHPAVKGILMWGFWERANWIPQSSLYLRDWTPTPAAEAYRDLVFNKWWTNFKGRMDNDGNCRLRVFYGKHRVTVDGREKIVNFTKASGSQTVLTFLY